MDPHLHGQQPDAFDERERLFSGQRGRGGVLRPSQAGVLPQAQLRGRLDGRVHQHAQRLHGLVPGQADQDGVRHEHHGSSTRARSCGMIGGDGINDESNKTAPAPTRNTDLTKNRERLARPKSTLRHSKISIHAPRRGSDDLADLILDTISRISIHAPRMGSDSAFLERPELHFQFQSTLPGWGATGRIGTWVWTIIFQSTLPGWGATVAGNIIGRGQIFQSTLPGWGATTRSGSESPLPEYFNPRSPDGERPMIYFSFSSVALFQSTLPGWGATRRPLSQSPGFRISIHAPRMGSDCRSAGSPCPRRPISIHAPRMGSD